MQDFPPPELPDLPPELPPLPEQEPGRDLLYKEQMKRREKAMQNDGSMGSRKKDVGVVGGDASDGSDMASGGQESATSDSLYLSQLVYTPEVGNTFLSFFIRNFRVIVLIVMGIILFGLISYGMLPLESNPEVKIPFGVVTVSMPGASPADMEELVVRKVENKVVNLTGVKQVTSSALNSFASVSVEFRAEED